MLGPGPLLAVARSAMPLQQFGTHYLLISLIILTTYFYLDLNAASKRLSRNYHLRPSQKRCLYLWLISFKLTYQLYMTDWLISAKVEAKSSRGKISMYSRPEELSFLCIIQTQQNVRIFSYLTHKVLHVDVEVETRHFLWRSMKFQHLLTRSTHKCLAWSKSSMVTTRSPNSKTEGHLLQQDKKVTIQIFGFSTRQFLDRTLKKKTKFGKNSCTRNLHVWQAFWSNLFLVQVLCTE